MTEAIVSETQTVMLSNDLEESFENFGVNPRNLDFIDLIERPAWKTILVSVIESNKMDPWKIDVGELTSKYLQKIKTLQQTNLRLPANAILVCALLLKFKSRLLKFTEFFDEPIQEDFFKTHPEFKDLQNVIPVLKNPKRLREGKVSLDALVNVIEEMLNKTKDGKEMVKKVKALEDVDFNIHLNEVDLEEKLKDLMQLILNSRDSQGLVLFSQIIADKPVAELVKTFLYTLYLANNQKILIWQEELFDSEIFISIKPDVLN